MPTALAQIPLSTPIMKSCAGIPYEELLRPETTLPEQFLGMWHGSQISSPEHGLAVAVLWQAATDLQKFRFAKRRKQQRLYRKAYEWVAVDDRSWPFSFVNLCESLKLSPTYLRAQLLGETPEWRMTRTTELGAAA